MKWGNKRSRKSWCRDVSRYR